MSKQQQPTKGPSSDDRVSTPSHAPPTMHHNMLSQHSSQQPSSSSKRKVAFPGHTSSSASHTPSVSSLASNDSLRKDGIEAMEVDRPHPIADSAPPTYISTTPTHPLKGHKDRHPPNMYTTGAGSLNDEMLTQQNGSTFAVPNGKKPHGLKLDITPVKENPPRRHSMSNKSPEVRLTKLVSPTGKLLSNQSSFNSENNSNRMSNSQETKARQLLQSQGSQEQTPGGGEFNSLWMGAGSSSLQTQGDHSNFLPSFDSDMAFRQLSFTPPSSVQQQQQHVPTPVELSQQQQRGQSKGHQDQRLLKQQHHQQQQLPDQRSLTQQHTQQQSYHQDIQQQGHLRESPLMRGAPPPYQPPPTTGRSGGSSAPSAFSPPLQYPLSNTPHNSSLQGHSPEKQRTQSPLAFSQQHGMDVLYSSQQQRSPDLHQQHHRQPQVQHGFNQGLGPQPQQQHGGGSSRTAGPLQKQQQASPLQQIHQAPSVMERQASGVSSLQQIQQGPSVVEQQASGASSLQQKSQGASVVERQTMSGGNPASATSSLFNPVSGVQGMNTSLHVQSQRANETQPQPQLNESLSIPTLHDLHNDLNQQRTRSSPLLGIPSFHQIQLHRGNGSNASSPQSVQGMDITASNSNSPLLSSVQLQNPSPLHPGPSISPHAHARSGSPHTQRTGSPMSSLHQRLTLSQQQSQQQQHQQQQVRTSISPLHQQARHLSPVQQPSPPAMLQQHGLQTHSRSPHPMQAGLQQPQQEIQMPQLHQLAQHSSPKRHQLPQVNLQGPQVQNQTVMNDSSMLNLGGQFSSPIQQQQHLGSPQKIHLYPTASQQQQQATAILQQQQQQLLQAQAQAQRQFILQQQQQRQHQHSPTYVHGSSSAQAFFPVGGGGSPTMAMLNTTASTNKQLAHPQLTHLSMLQGGATSGRNLLNQQPMVMGGNPYATSFSQGLPLLPNGTAGIPGAGQAFQQPGQNMGSPLRHFHSQGR